MDKGALVPDELVLGMIADRLGQDDAQHGFILDGFPRTVPQAEALGRMLQGRSEKLDKVVAITVPVDEIVKRISGRRTCRACSAMYHVTYEPPRVPNVCDACSGPLYQREDRARLEVYATATRPLLDYYGTTGILAEIDGTGQPEEIERRIQSALEASGSKAR
jgi:adenylate kinase